METKADVKNYGMEIFSETGEEWKANKHLNIHADFTWRLNDIFKKILQRFHLPCIPFI